MKHILLIILTLFCGITNGQQFNASYGKPLIVLKETDPWLMSIGSDIASFALYEKGQIIYKSVENKKLKIYEVTLNQNELKKVIQSFSIPKSLYSLKENIIASDWTDQPSNELYLNITKKKTISVYGSLRKKAAERKRTPIEFLTVYDNIKKYRNNAAKEWLPNKIEIIFWDYDYAPNKRKWIKGFPDLNSKTTIKYSNDSYSVFIDKAKFEEFKKYYSKMGEKEAVEINGRKMAISYRLPFPNLK
ncbi:MAG: hypothetical protein K2Y30_02440 [Flavobacteriaceae bacterium]|nr:hypothetical protein [Flavobacteriaceae bacterium]